MTMCRELRNLPIMDFALLRTCLLAITIPFQINCSNICILTFQCVDLDPTSLLETVNKLCDEEIHFELQDRKLVPYGWKKQSQKLAQIYKGLT